jgi:hypothetical protein
MREHNFAIEFNDNSRDRCGVIVVNKTTTGRALNARLNLLYQRRSAHGTELIFFHKLDSLKDSEIGEKKKEVDVKFAASIT